MTVGEELGVALRAALDGLKLAGIEHALIGGLALNVLRRVRATRDIDLLVAVAAADLDTLRTALRAAGFAHQTRVDTVSVDDASVLHFWWPLRDLGISLKVDIVAGRLPFHARVLARKRQIDALDQSLPVAAVEDVILLTLLAGRPLDLADAAELHSIHAASLDTAYLETTAKELGVGERLVALRTGR